MFKMSSQQQYHSLKYAEIEYILPFTYVFLSSSVKDEFVLPLLILSPTAKLENYFVTLH